ncbi:MAG: pyruvate kinase [Candidatus Falkowbacteria bacterium]
MINKQTKIVATISNKNCSVDFLRKLHDAGMDVVRLNTAHQTPEESSEVVAKVRATSQRLAIMVDTKGPEIRTRYFAEGISLPVKKGQLVKMAGSAKGESAPGLMLVDYPRFAAELSKGSQILIDDGELALEVVSKKKDHVVVKVMNEGVIKGKKSVNVPGVSLTLPSLSIKDKTFIDWAMAEKIDFIAHSFVRDDKDVLAIRKLLDAKKSPIKIIAKIENRAGVENIDKIIAVADGIMVARGDLGVEIPMEEVPFVQKLLIRKCVEQGKSVITATQMLHSMIQNPRPTRAEVSDVTNAMLDGTDAVMLSGETAYGDHALAAVRTMATIACKVDVMKSLVYSTRIRPEHRLADYLSKAAVKMAEELGAKEIILSDVSDYSAEMVASYRPSVPVFVKCVNETRARQLALSYGIYAHCLPKEEFNNGMLRKMLTDLVRKGKLKSKDLIVYLSGEQSSGLVGDQLEICQVAKYIKK